ncbi:hypothetical protein ACFP1I_12555 [Dyadobacter subterraneus]|uniref:DUF3945 domain-containing protein n=1 Tax=Dyadobacter subterraneus TaxID=2773304 RepID=A0ABR9WAR2_9BACT|nr:hypothetical protein [Dyadobacter subterraneus]MBE9462061.1 hypothetical protein [Dyadobacter subterraneus]
MNQRNLDYLQNQLKYTGFGENLTDQLKENLAKENSRFVLVHKAQYGKDELTAALQFSRSMQSELYFFNSYKASLAKSGQGGGPSQRFYIGKEGSNITLKEAYNLLDGRSVHKDMTTRQGRLYQAWLQLDFKNTLPNGNFKMLQFGRNYGFDLFESLKKLPIQEIHVQADRVKILDSLKKGNRQQVTLSGPSDGQKVFIEANPQFKAIILYDSSYHRMRQSPQAPAVSEERSQAVKQDDKTQKNSADRTQRYEQNETKSTKAKGLSR